MARSNAGQEIAVSAPRALRRSSRQSEGRVGGNPVQSQMEVSTTGSARDRKRESPVVLDCFGNCLGKQVCPMLRTGQFGP